MIDRTNIKYIKISKIVDATGLYCPAPIAMLKAQLEEINNGDVVKIVADDPSFRKDIVRWCNLTGNELIYIRKDKRGFTICYIRKK